MKKKRWDWYVRGRVVVDGVVAVVVVVVGGMGDVDLLSGREVKTKDVFFLYPLASRT